MNANARVVQFPARPTPARASRLARSPARSRAAAWLLILGALLGSPGAYGQAFPNKLVRIVTADPGGGNELAARLIAAELTKTFGQQVIVESRGGASGALAAQAVSRAAPDGYTLLLYSSGLWVTPLLRDVP